MDDFDRSAGADRLFAACGRALTLATRFEAGCRAVFKMAGIAADPTVIFSSSDRMNEFAATIKKKPLNAYLSTLGNAFSSDRLEQLFNAAREARNEIAHELTLGMDYSLSDPSEQQKVLGRLERIIPPLAEADAVVSTLLTHASAEPFPAFLRDYPRLIQRWVCDLEPDRSPN